MFGKIRAYLKIFFTVLALAFYLTQLLTLTWIFGQSDARGFKYRRKFIRAAMWFLDIDLKLEGEIPEGHFLLVSNHRSMFDPLILLKDIDAFVVSKAEVENYPLLGRGAKETGVIYVKRDEKSSRGAALTAIRDGLKSGKNILIYPEGTTSNVDTTIEFRVGSFNVASDLEISVIPIALDYQEKSDYWVNKPLLPHVISILARGKMKTMIRIGSPINNEDPKKLMQECRDWINQQIPEMHAALNPDQEKILHTS
jgi:1-acyl-sn-glycerol-3-phosphate acyltransferase